MDNLVEKNELVIRQQYGYKKENGTTDLLEHFSETVDTALNNHLHVVVCFVDFTKAFDTLNHTILLEDLVNIRPLASQMQAAIWNVIQFCRLEKFLQRPAIPCNRVM